jgi:peptidoglycan hydrolase CwlO-like protein
MWRAHRSLSGFSVLAAAVIWAGCASSGPPKSDLETEFTRSQHRISELETTLSKQESEISKLSESLDKAQSKTPDVASHPLRNECQPAARALGPGRARGRRL